MHHPLVHVHVILRIDTFSLVPRFERLESYPQKINLDEFELFNAGELEYSILEEPSGIQAS